MTKTIVSKNFANEDWQQSVSDEFVEKCISEVEGSEEKYSLDKFGLKCNKKMALFG